MTKETEIHLRRILQRLEQTTEKMIATRGYTKDAAQVRLLQELIKEQVQHADTDTSTRPLR
jgi:hypothetical protein